MVSGGDMKSLLKSKETVSGQRKREKRGRGGRKESEEEMKERKKERKKRKKKERKKERK